MSLQYRQLIAGIELPELEFTGDIIAEANVALSKGSEVPLTRVARQTN